MKTSIKYKILPIIIIGILIMGTVFGALFITTQKDTLNQIYLKDINLAKKMFYNLESTDVKMLQAAMNDFMTNDQFKKEFSQGLKEYEASGNCSASNLALYNEAKDLYAKHKAMGITHFYFETVTNKIFLRVHGQSNCGDNLARTTYLESKQSNSWGTGIELGKTAFALRVVSPYYDGDNLIGYIEYGEEIDHFLQIMKEQTGNDFAIIVKKDKIKAADWETLTKNNGIRNNYDDYANYLMISSTDHAITDVGQECWDEDKLNTVDNEGSIFSIFNKDDKNYLCGGFSLYDASESKIGAILVVKDITREEAAAAKTKQSMIIITAILILIIGGVVMFIMNKLVINPLKSLTEAGNKVNEGAIDTPLPAITSDDEIKDLSNTMNSLIEGMKFFKKESAEKPKKK